MTRLAARLDYAIQTPTGKWWLVSKGKLQPGEHVSADSAERVYSEKEKRA